MLSVASALAAANVLLALLCGFIAVSLVVRLKHGAFQADTQTHAIGLMLFAGGWSLHRMYWAMNRALESGGYDFLLTSIYTSSAGITLVPIILILYGGGMLLAPVLGTVYGEAWMQRYLITVISIWLILAVAL